MEEYRRSFERMQVINLGSNGDCDVALDYMRYFKVCDSRLGLPDPGAMGLPWSDSMPVLPFRDFAAVMAAGRSDV